MAAKVISAKPRKSSWLRRILKWFMLLLVILFVGFVFVFVPVFLSGIIVGASTRPSDRADTRTPATFGAPNFEEVSFLATDGAQISAWYIPNNQKGIDIVM